MKVDFLNDEHRRRFSEARDYMQTNAEHHLCMLYILTGCQCLGMEKIKDIIDYVWSDYDSIEMYDERESKRERTKKFIKHFGESEVINLLMQQAIYFGCEEMYLPPEEGFAYRLDNNNQAALLGGMVLYHFYHENNCKIDHIHQRGSKPVEFDCKRFS